MFLNPYYFTGPVVAFTAYIDSTRSLSTRTVFNKLLLNEADAYDESTGVFTCPRTGIYMFSFVGGKCWFKHFISRNVYMYVCFDPRIYYIN